MPESLDAPENRPKETLRQVAFGMLVWQHGCSQDRGVALGPLTECDVVPRYLRRPESAEAAVNQSSPLRSPGGQPGRSLPHFSGETH